MFVLAGVIAAACSGSDEDGAADPGRQVGLGPAPTVVVVDCPAELADTPEAWPVLLPEALAVTDFVVDETSFLARGITNDPELVLVDTTDISFVGFSSGEPEGGANDLVVIYESETATGTLFLEDDDEDGCWNAELEVDFFEAPNSSDLILDDGSGLTATSELADAADDPADSGADVDADGGDGSELVDPEGVGTVTTAQGTFGLNVSTCQLAPLSIIGSADEGELEISPGDDENLDVVWVYADGVEVRDEQANPVALSSNSVLVVADGENDEGPETVIADIVCNG